MVELYFAIKVICMIIGLSAASAFAIYELWKWFH